jgi:hypothetical protein
MGVTFTAAAGVVRPSTLLLRASYCCNTLFLNNIKRVESGAAQIAGRCAGNNSGDDVFVAPMCRPHSAAPALSPQAFDWMSRCGGNETVVNHEHNEDIYVPLRDAFGAVNGQGRKTLPWRV